MRNVYKRMPKTFKSDDGDVKQNNSKNDSLKDSVAFVYSSFLTIAPTTFPTSTYDFVFAYEHYGLRLKTTEKRTEIKNKLQRKTKQKSKRSKVKSKKSLIFYLGTLSLFECCLFMVYICSIWMFICVAVFFSFQFLW